MKRKNKDSNDRIQDKGQPETNAIKLDIKCNIEKSKSRKMRWGNEREIKVSHDFLAVS